MADEKFNDGDGYEADIYDDDMLEENCSALWATIKARSKDEIDVTVRLIEVPATVDSFIEVATTVNSFIESVEQQLSAVMKDFSNLVSSKSDGFCAESYDARLFKRIGLVSVSKVDSKKQFIAEDDGYVTGQSAPASPAI